MDKQAFLCLLRERLTEYKVSEENTNKYIRQFERYFNTMTDDEVNDQIENYEGVEGIAQNILKLIKKKQDTAQKLSSSNQKEGDTTITFPVTQLQLKKENSAEDGDTREIDTVKSKTSGNIQTSVNNFSEHADTEIINIEDEAETKKISDNGIDNNVTDGDDKRTQDNYDNPKKTGSKNFTPAVMAEINQPEDKERQHLPASGHIERINRQGQAAVQGETAGNRNIKKRTGDMVPVRRKTGSSPDINLSGLDESFIEDTAIPNTTLYWVIILLTIPLSVPLFLTVLFLFIAAFAFLSVSIVALFATLVFDVVAGTGLSLVGIIYGVTQIYTSLPIGLFEIGFGVIIGGSAMLSGILIYNAAIRFLPFVIKYLIVFFMFTMYKIKEFFKFVKKECAKQ